MYRNDPIDQLTEAVKQAVEAEIESWGEENAPSDEERAALEVIRANYWSDATLEQFAEVEAACSIDWILNHASELAEWEDTGRAIPDPGDMSTEAERNLLDLIRQHDGLLAALSTLLRIVNVTKRSQTAVAAVESLTQRF